jgi:predicted AlkP superfamily pyrophosphatase or phosphodiesterase
MRKALALSIGVVVAAAGAGAFAWQRGAVNDASKLDVSERNFSTNDPIERACDLQDRMLVRLWRGHHPVHSEDITTVPQAPNYSGSFGVTSHSGPWDYVQNIPLVLYGPGHIAARGPLQEFASITDVFGTAGRLTGVELPERRGDVLESALESSSSRPKLIAVVVWDGIGRNVLRRHPDAWPQLKRLEEEGTSYLGATVGSSPSITPATHSSLGTGSFPNEHGVTAIEYRTADGEVRGAFAQKDPRDLKLTTFADEIDRALGNEPRVGMLAWKSWHLGMLGHGSATPGGDADSLALINTHGSITGNEQYFSIPAGLTSLEGNLEKHAEKLDREDGTRDGEWLDHDIRARHDNPAWVRYQRDLMLAMLESEDFGEDATPDLFLTNFKVTDIVSHQYSMDSREEREVLAAQDAALGDLVAWLESNVGDFVVIVTSDHGNTPPPERSDAWPILQGQLQEDIDAHFDIPRGRSLLLRTTAAGPFLDKALMKKLGISETEVARFLNGYTLKDNWKDDRVPARYEDRVDEKIFSAAWPSDETPAVMSCAFGEPRPPEDIDA